MLTPESIFKAFMVTALFQGAERAPGRDDGADRAYRTPDGLVFYQRVNGDIYALRTDLDAYDRGARPC